MNVSPLSYHAYEESQSGHVYSLNAKTRLRVRAFSSWTHPLRTKILVRPWPDWPKRLLRPAIVRTVLCGVYNAVEYH